MTSADREKVEKRYRFVLRKLADAKASLKKLEQEKSDLELMLTIEEYDNFRPAPLPGRGTKLEATLELLASDPEKAWPLKELVPALEPDLSESDPRAALQRVQQRLARLMEKDHVRRAGHGLYEIREASAVLLGARLESRKT